MLTQKSVCSLTSTLIHSEGGRDPETFYEFLPLFHTIVVVWGFVLFRQSPVAEAGINLSVAETGLVIADLPASTCQRT